ncbi:ankyrin repeat domain-containing protein [Candidatus Babeliales bacterium]|nr:ankyrin repeat domain-containing protein [Candidatus Babeliales bacterium]
MKIKNILFFSIICASLHMPLQAASWLSSFFTPSKQEISDFFEAIEKDNLELVKDMLQKKPALLNCQDCDSCETPPLHKAVKHNNLEIVKTLSQYPEIKVNCIDCWDKTALLYAIDEQIKKTVDQKNNAIIVALLQAGANPNTIVDHTNTPPLHWAIKNDSEIATFIINSKNANLNIKNIIGNGPIHRAIDLKRFDLARLLIEKGADVNAIGNEKATPLLMVMSEGYTKRR